MKRCGLLIYFIIKRRWYRIILQNLYTALYDSHWKWIYMRNKKIVEWKLPNSYRSDRFLFVDIIKMVCISHVFCIAILFFLFDLSSHISQHFCPFHGNETERKTKRRSIATIKLSIAVYCLWIDWLVGGLLWRQSNLNRAHNQSNVLCP